MSDRLFPEQKFPLGRTVITVGAQEAISQEKALVMLKRHASGDWGAMCDEDKAQNDAGLNSQNRLHSAYPIDDAKPCAGHGPNTIWVITEWDRSVTTLLLPDEY